MPLSEIDSLLETIAQSELGIVTLKTRNSDSHDTSVSSLKRALLRAYSEGFLNGQKSIEERFYYREYEC